VDLQNILIFIVGVLVVIAGSIMIFGSRWVIFLLNFVSMSEGQYPTDDIVKYRPKSSKARISGITILIIGIVVFFYGLINLF